MPRRRISLSFDEAWNLVKEWKSKEGQLEEVSYLFYKKKITNITRIRLRSQIINGNKTK